MIIKDINVYDGSLIHKRFAYKFFRKQTLPIGNIIAFRGAMDVVGANMIDMEDVLNKDFIYSKDAINFCWEIPNICSFGAVVWQRYFNTQVAQILSTKYLKKPIEVDGDDLMVHDEFVGSDNAPRNKGKCSVSITYSKNNVAIGHTGINVDAGRQAPPFAYSTKLTDEQCENFMTEIIQMFYDINDDMFIASTKVDF